MSLHSKHHNCWELGISLYVLNRLSALPVQYNVQYTQVETKKSYTMHGQKKYDEMGNRLFVILICNALVFADAEDGQGFSWMS